MSKYLFQKKHIIIFLIVVLLIIIISKIFKKEEDDTLISFEEIETTTIIENNQKNYIDIKGAVNNPGVYEFKENDRVIDAIELAGGLKDNANTTNINLSKKLTSEMVIYIYNNNEIKENTVNLTCDNVCKREVIEVNNCVEVTTTKRDNNKTNINTASLEELKLLEGIGEAKAKAIIEYRNNNLFKNIEEIKNIAGIGESLFNKIKDDIEV